MFTAPSLTLFMFLSGLDHPSTYWFISLATPTPDLLHSTLTLPHPIQMVRGAVVQGSRDFILPFCHSGVPVVFDYPLVSRKDHLTITCASPDTSAHVLQFMASTLAVVGTNWSRIFKQYLTVFDNGWVEETGLRN